MKCEQEINKYIISEIITEKHGKAEDDYVSKTMGEFGYYQALICPIAALSRFIVMWNIMCIVFLTPLTEFTCVRFKDDINRNGTISTCYADCLEYKYHSKVLEETIISTFDLICDNAWLVSFTQSIAMLGLVIGVSLFGWVSDRYGRRITYIISTVTAVAFTLAASFATNYWVFTALRFFTGLGSGGIMTLSVVVNVEMVGPKYRELAGAMSLLPDGVAFMSIAAIASFITTWNTLLLVFGVIGFFILLLLTFVPDTPRWLISQRKTEKAIAMMTAVAKFNKLETSHIRETVQKAIEALESQQKDVQKLTILDLFKGKKMAMITVTCVLVWIVAGICYFGINHYSTLLGLNIYVIVPLMGLFQVIGNLLALLVNRYFGRRISSFGALILIGILMLILIFIPDGHWGCGLLTGIGLVFSIMIICIAYVHVNEIYPTPLRNMGIGLSCGGAKVGAMISPFIANTQPHWIASTMFAVIPFIGAFLCFLLPETKGKKLKDTID